MPAFICSQISPGDIAKRHMWRRGRSTLSSTRSKVSFSLHHTFWFEMPMCCCPECLTASSFCRFEFDVSLQEVQTRKLDVSVKNNKMFYTRERKDIGMVGRLPGSVDSIKLSIRTARRENIVSRSALVHRYRLILQTWMFPKASHNGTDTRAHTLSNRCNCLEF